MGWLIRFAKSSIGAKLVMALTGVILVGFVIAHMIGNLQVFLGPDALRQFDLVMFQQCASRQEHVHHRQIVINQCPVITAFRVNCLTLRIEHEIEICRSLVILVPFGLEAD